MSKAVRIEGLKEVRSAIRGISDDMDRNGAKGRLRVLNLEAAEVVKQKADGLVPRRTGKLARSVRAAASQKSARVRAGYQRVPYAGPIHFGWPARGIRPNPFLYDALDARRGQVVEVYERGIDRLIRDYDLD
jgi:hypothetical protein